MPGYYHLGEVPSERHTRFLGPDDIGYTEETFGDESVPGNYSTLYHRHSPTRVRKVTSFSSLNTSIRTSYEPWCEGIQRHHYLRTAALGHGGDAILGQRTLLFNSDMIISITKPTEPMNYFFRHGNADLLYYVQQGSGTLESIFGLLPFHEGDSIIIPCGTTFRFVHTASSEPTVFLVLEAYGTIEMPQRYHNNSGHASYSEQTIQRPQELILHTETGEFEVRMKVGTMFTSYWYDYHPYDVIGWDGYVYPWIVKSADLVAATDDLHPLFQGPDFTVSIPVQQPLDNLTIPSPCVHTNTQQDELLYALQDQAEMEAASIVLHPRSIPHREDRQAERMAVKVTTTQSLKLTTIARTIDDPTYPYRASASEFLFAN